MTRDGFLGLTFPSCCRIRSRLSPMRVRSLNPYHTPAMSNRVTTILPIPTMNPVCTAFHHSVKQPEKRAALMHLLGLETRVGRFISGEIVSHRGFLWY